MRNAILMVLLAAVSGSAAAITVVNDSSLVPLPDSPFTARIVRGQYGPELVVSGTVSDRTAADESLVAAEINFVVIQADGTVLWSGPSDMNRGNRFEWRLMVKPAGVIDGDLITEVKITNGKIVTADTEEREAREKEERRAREKVESAVTFPVVNESSLVPLPDAPFTATIVSGQYGPELVVAGVASDRTTAGERLEVADINFIATMADGTVRASGYTSTTAGKRIEWRHLGGLKGFVDGDVIAQIKMTDRKIVTTELLEREAREQAEIARQAAVKREREVRKREKSEREAALKHARQREVAIHLRRWPEKIERAVIERKIMLGMSAEQVTMAWGAPVRTNETIHASGRSEQWVYSTSSYVYFQNGRVTSIQSSR